MRTNINSCCRCFWCSVGVESPDGDFDDKHLGIGGLTEGTNIGHMGLSWFEFNEVHCTNSFICNLGDNLRDAVSFRFNVSDSFAGGGNRVLS